MLTATDTWDAVQPGDVNPRYFEGIDTGLPGCPSALATPLGNLWCTRDDDGHSHHVAESSAGYVVATWGG